MNHLIGQVLTQQNKKLWEEKQLWKKEVTTYVRW